jgi:hypothetical protein
LLGWRRTEWVVIDGTEYASGPGKLSRRISRSGNFFDFLFDE